MRKKAFDNKKYIKLQKENILKRVADFDGKLYLEIGGKIFDDTHAARVLPGFEVNAKVKVLLALKSRVEVIITVNAKDIDDVKTRFDNGITYENECLHLYDQFENAGLAVAGLVITQYMNQPSTAIFKRKLENMGIKTYLHYPISGYPRDVDYILSDEGFGKNDFIGTTRPIVVVVAPGAGSGKMATCLSQLYHENKRGLKAGYAKYETFPIWNLDLHDPVNLAYESATADLKDVIMMDYFHHEAYNIPAVTYNRDYEAFPVLRRVFEKIYGKSPYQSPTDMGVNMLGFCLLNKDAIDAAGKQEIIRRYLNSKCRQKLGIVRQEGVDKIAFIMKELNIGLDDRKCVKRALDKAREENVPAVAIELPNGKMITGKKSALFEAPSAAIINAVKYLAKIPDDMPLISPAIIEPIQNLKQKQLNKSVRMYLDEVLISLAITGSTNAMAQRALEQLSRLAGSQLHSTVMLHPDDVETLKKLKIDVTTEAYQDVKIWQR